MINNQWYMSEENRKHFISGFFSSNKIMPASLEGFEPTTSWARAHRACAPMLCYNHCPQMNKYWSQFTFFIPAPGDGGGSKQKIADRIILIIFSLGWTSLRIESPCYANSSIHYSQCLLLAHSSTCLDFPILDDLKLKVTNSSWLPSSNHWKPVCMEMRG